jgi:hypothetical protein
MPKESTLLNKPQGIFNVEEFVIQTINNTGKFVVKKGLEICMFLLHARGQYVTVMAGCNAELQFLPPILIFKGANKNQEFWDGLPHGSEAYRNPKLSCINSAIFLK